MGHAEGSGHLAIGKMLSRWGHSVDKGIGQGIQGPVEGEADNEVELAGLGHPELCDGREAKALRRG